MVAFISIVIGNLASYWLKEDLKDRGYKVNYFWNHLRDFENARRVVATTDDQDLKWQYKKCLIIINFSFISFFACVLLLISIW